MCKNLTELLKQILDDPPITKVLKIMLKGALNILQSVTGRLRTIAHYCNI